MRSPKSSQDELIFQVSGKSVAKVTLEYFARYVFISTYLDAHPGILKTVHRDLKKPLADLGKAQPKGGACRFTSDTVLRMVLVKHLEDATFRGTVIQVDDSPRLRAFTRIHNGIMMDPSTLCRLNNAISEETWKKINRLLANLAVEEGVIDGDKLRIDTTAVETNIHYPTDSALLWDSYRVLSRLLRKLRDLFPDLLLGKRFHTRLAKRLHASIGRNAGKKKKKAKQRLKKAFQSLIGLVERLLVTVDQVCGQVQGEGPRHARSATAMLVADGLVLELQQYRMNAARVVDQARRRVLLGEEVPNDEKIFSIFEPHTELLIRGKAGKRIEFGHMVSIQQVGSKFISGYEVFEKKPADHTLLDAALKSHETLFGSLPRVLAGDKGFWEDTKKMDALLEDIPVVSIGKKGRRTEEETAREHSIPFRLAQRFRAGIEGTIGFLKSFLGMWRCMNKGLDHFGCTVGATVFVHNLLLLSRSTT